VPAPPTASDAETSPPVTRREWIIFGVILLVTIGLRCAYPSRLDVEHFDEGVYAGNEFSPQTEFKYPYRDLYAPPLIPAMASIGVLLAGGDPVGAVWVGILGGVLLIPILWWTARSWFGVPAGLVVATLAATSDYHIWLSRSILTDAWLCVWMTSGVFAGWKALTTRSWLWTIAAGGLASLAWWTKYNGWLTLAIIAGGWLIALIASLSDRVERRWLQKSVAGLLQVAIIVGIALLAWYPVLVGLEPIGGYAAVARNHAGYFGGLFRWWPSLTRQAGSTHFITGPATIVGALAASILATSSFRTESTPRRRYRTWAAWPLAFALAGPLVATGLLGALPLARWFVARRQDSEIFNRDDRKLALAFTCAWVGGLTLAVPLYTPYPRLCFPWLCGLWLAMGAAVSLLSEPDARETSNELSNRWDAIITLSGSVLLAMVWIGAGGIPLRHGMLDQLVFFESRRGLRNGAEQVRTIVQNHLSTVPPTRIADVEAVLYVVGEPALYDHLVHQESTAKYRYICQADSSLGMLEPGESDPRVPTYVVLGGRFARDHRDEIAKHSSLLSLVQVVSASQSSFVLLDEVPPQDLAGRKGWPTNDIEIYYVNASR
jgi:dolichyl-phosphate-mannose-protein mannosyltransferase